MDSSITQLALFTLGGLALGGLLGWFIQAAISKRRIGQLTSETLTKLEQVTARKEQVLAKYAKARSKVEQLQAADSRHRTDLESALSKSKVLAKNVRVLRKERETTKSKLSTLQNALVTLRQQTSQLQTEFEKSREFYKRELLKSLQRRQEMEEEVMAVREEQASFAEQVESSVLEHGSEENMVIAAQLRFGQLEVLERNISKLETENTHLRNQATQLKQEIDARDRVLADFEELKLHNQQLVRCVEALEDSRKESEADAERFRQQADESEKLSDTLRLKLDDLEKNFADIEKQQSQALEDAREAAVVPILRKQV